MKKNFNFIYFIQPKFASEGFTIHTHATSAVPKPSHRHMKSAKKGKRRHFRENGRGRVRRLRWTECNRCICMYNKCNAYDRNDHPSFYFNLIFFLSQWAPTWGRLLHTLLSLAAVMFEQGGQPLWDEGCGNKKNLHHWERPGNLSPLMGFVMLVMIVPGYNVKFRKDKRWHLLININPISARKLQLVGRFPRVCREMCVWFVCFWVSSFALAQYGRHWGRTQVIYRIKRAQLQSCCVFNLSVCPGRGGLRRWRGREEWMSLLIVLREAGSPQGASWKAPICTGGMRQKRRCDFLH